MAESNITHYAPDGQEPVRCCFTREEIAERLRSEGNHEVATIISDDAWFARVKSIPLERWEGHARRESVPDAEYDAYAYIWRNLTGRFSDEFSAYQLSRDERGQS